ncbi:MAG TPA: PilN domain-containing protein [Acetivibrio clariflavus]|nr:PilN domain-containing protein [Acetivibrio clariflavus]
MKDINLLPEEIKSTTTYSPAESKSGSVVKAIVILFFILVVVGVTIAAPKFYIKTLERELDSINKEIESEKYEPVRQVRAKLDAINGVIASKGDIMDTIDKKAYPVNEVLVSLNSVTPQGCQITKITYSSNRLEINGIARDRMVVAEFVARINRLEFFNITGSVRMDKSNAFTLFVEVGAIKGGKEGK